MERGRRPIVNFSLRREVFFVVAGSFLGAFAMHVPRAFMDLLGGPSYHLTLLVSASVVGSRDPAAGFLLHLFVATVIGIVTGILLHKAIRFKISKVANGITYGIIAGTVVFAVFAIPVSQLVLGPNTAAVISELYPDASPADAAGGLEGGLAAQMLGSLAMHLIWGVTLGTVASLLTRKMGANYRCHTCDIEFSKLRTWEDHREKVHESPSPDMKRILILGGGYAGVGVLSRIQRSFQDDVNVGISMVSESNFFLHTPMLAEMATGTVEPRHIATPIRRFCKRARFHQARVTGIDLESKRVAVRKTPDGVQEHIGYDYLVIATGSRVNFFGNANIERRSLTIKSLDDAIRIRNRVIGALEDADQEQDGDRQAALATFVVVGGGFSGVETAGELNEFVRESVSKYYRNIPQDRVRVVLVASGGRILPEIGNLGGYARDALLEAGVTIHTNTRLKDATGSSAVLDSGEEIPCGVLIWAGGNRIDELVAGLPAEHHERSGRIVVDGRLRLKGYPDVFALGDCAYVVDPRDGKPYPPTAQHAIRQAGTVAANLESAINGTASQSEFSYDTRGSMAKIGKRDGVALLMGREVHGIAAWFVWKQYYLSTLPTAEKKIRVGLDWFVDLFFPRDITRLSNAFEGGRQSAADAEDVVGHDDVVR